MQYEYEVLYAHRTMAKIFHMSARSSGLILQFFFGSMMLLNETVLCVFGVAVNIYIEVKCIKRNMEYSMQVASESNVVFEYFIAWDTREVILYLPGTYCLFEIRINICSLKLSSVKCHLFSI